MRLAVVLLAVVSVACGAPPAEEGAPLLIATSIPPHSWLVAEIGGEAVEAIHVLDPGDNPATHQPSDAQVSRVMSCRLFFSAGVPFESGPWLAALAHHIEIVDLGEGVIDRVMEGNDHGHGMAGPSHKGLDPHAWLSPKRLAVQARRVANALTRLAPERAEAFAANLQAFEAELEALDGEIRGKLEPYRGRAFVVFHPSWGYFADDYGLRQIPIEIEGKEPSDAEITALQQEARDLGITVVFVQPQIAARSAAAVADALGAELATLDPLAADIPANLRHAAEVLAETFHD